MASSPAAQASRRNTRLEPDERRRQLLSAARRLFNERHYGAVSTEDIAAEAGVARGLINHYFGTKRDLYVEVVREMVRVPPPVPEYVQGTTPRRRIAESIDAWLEMVWRNRETWLASMHGAGLAAGDEIGVVFEQAREEAAARMVAVLGLGPVTEAGPELLAVMRAYGGMAEAATVQWLEHGRLTRGQVATLLTESALRLSDDVLDTVLETDTQKPEPKEKARR